LDAPFVTDNGNRHSWLATIPTMHCMAQLKLILI